MNLTSYRVSFPITDRYLVESNSVSKTSFFHLKKKIAEKTSKISLENYSNWQYNQFRKLENGLGKSINV